MAKRKDIRSARSQYFIRKALVEMLEKRPLSELSVAEITEKAEVSRRTFYIYYESKNDCLITILKELMQEIFQLNADETTATATTLSAEMLWMRNLREKLECIFKNRVLLRAMFRDLNTDEWMALIRTPYEEQMHGFWERSSREEPVLALSQELCKVLDCMQLAIYLRFLAEADLTVDNAYSAMNRMLQIQKQRRSQWEKALFGTEVFPDL